MRKIAWTRFLDRLFPAEAGGQDDAAPSGPGWEREAGDDPAGDDAAGTISAGSSSAWNVAQERTLEPTDDRWGEILAALILCPLSLRSIHNLSGKPRRRTEFAS